MYTVKPEVHVAVGVIENAAGEILLARRATSADQGGLWEFPGGKIEAGESVRCALTRELNEELDIQVTQARPLISIPHRYPDYSVVLDVWRVLAYEGEPRGCEGQPLKWVTPQVLGVQPLPAANRAIVTAVQLPELYLITGEPVEGVGAYLARLETLLKSGITLVQYRVKTPVGAPLFNALAKQAVELCRDYHAKVLLNGLPEAAAACGADGVHLAGTRLFGYKQRPLPKAMMVAASCHSKEDVRHAANIGVDFIVISPVMRTATHPDAVPLGWLGFRCLSQHATVPAYALGGLSPDDLDSAYNNGAQGVACISALWQAGDRGDDITEPGGPLVSRVR